MTITQSSSSSLLLLLLISLVLVTNGKSDLSCHICDGGENTPCAGDAKSVQSLKCSATEAYVLAGILLRAIENDTRSGDSVSCLSISWRRPGASPRYVRSCLRSSSDICRKLEGAFLASDDEFLTCRQCTKDFCNSDAIVSNFRSVTVFGLCFNVIVSRVIF